MGTSTRKTDDRIKKIISNNKISSNGDGINRIISETLFPKNNNSKTKNDIINSTCSISFTKTIKKIITISKIIGNEGLTGIGINDYNKLMPNEQIEIIANELCYDEDPIIKQTVIDILQSKDLNLYLNNSYLVIKDFLTEYYTEKFESHMFEELATATNDFNDEECKQKIKLLVAIEVEKVFTYTKYKELIINMDEDSKLKNIFRNISSFIMRGLKV